MSELSEIIEKEFKEKKTVSLHYLYEKISKDHYTLATGKVLQHRIRAIISTWNKRNKIRRISPGTYEIFML